MTALAVLGLMTLVFLFFIFMQRTGFIVAIGFAWYYASSATFMRDAGGYVFLSIFWVVALILAIILDIGILAGWPLVLRCWLRYCTPGGDKKVAKKE